MTLLMFHDWSLLSKAMRCKCPKCGVGDLYETATSMDVRAECPECKLDLSKNDSADGPAVFMIFILGFLLVPLALAFEWLVMPPLWVHAVLWSVVSVAMVLGMLRPLKSYVVALQYKYNPWD